MDKTRTSFDWSMIATFLAVAETGSLSAAARRLGSSQPTVGRHIREMEEALGASLFHRQARGMRLTKTGAALIEPAQAMRAAAGRFSIMVAGAEETLSGTVRITASTFISHHVLPPIFARLRAEEPEIALELMPNDASDNLLFREADIAVRMYRPDQLDIVTRHVGTIAIGLYAARSYLQRVGRPQRVEDLRYFDFVGLDQNTELIDGFRTAGWPVDRDFFRTRCDAYTVGWELVRAGCGLGFAQRPVADADALVEEIELDLPVPGLPVWLAAHSALQQSPRIRRVWEALAEGLSKHVS